MTLLFAPDSMLSAVAGAMFGPVEGTVIVAIGSLIAQSLAFTISRRLLQARVVRMVQRRPKLAAIRRAADRQGLRLQTLLRLAPINQVAISHVLGTTGTSYRVFMLACLCIVPTLFVQVYIGYTAKHMIKVAGQVSDHSPLQTVGIVAGLVASLLVLVTVAQLARRALAEAEAEA
ncbi:MAG: VTT domain-containing protein [Pirellulales bacterium]|nr:TVP38/TMEM64 family protein [Planctomycetales bacterium]